MLKQHSLEATDRKKSPCKDSKTANHAIRAIGAMRQLDIEAEKLGLQTSYKKDQLEKMYKQLLPQIEAMKANRNKRKK